MSLRLLNMYMTDKRPSKEADCGKKLHLCCVVLIFHTWNAGCVQDMKGQ